MSDLDYHKVKYIFLLYYNMYNDYNDTVSFILNYLKENFIGLSLLLSAFLIIYVVDCISQINLSLFAMPSPIPFQSPIISSSNLSKIIPKRKKHKK